MFVQKCCQKATFRFSRFLDARNCCQKGNKNGKSVKNVSKCCQKGIIYRPRNHRVNPSSISQRLIENKFDSMDEERIHMLRNRFIKENARMSFSDMNSIPSTHNNLKYSPQKRGSKSLRCKYCYNIGQTESNCRKKEMKQPLSMPDWVAKQSVGNSRKRGICLSTFIQNMIINHSNQKIPTRKFY